MALTASASWRKDKGSSAERGYTWAWTKARNAYLKDHPLCVMCEASGRITIATVVDHIVAHRGSAELMWDESNWQSLCSTHHNSDKQMAERTGRKRAQFNSDWRVVW